MTTASPMLVEGFFDPATWTVSYLLLDVRTGDCALIDSVLDYDPKSGRTGTTTADRLVSRVHELGAKVQWLLETHVHADHLSAAPYLKERLGGKIAIGEQVTARARRVRQAVQRRLAIRARWQPVRSPALRWRVFHHRSVAGARHPYSGPYAGLHDLCGQRRRADRRLCRRHPVHARLRYRALRLSRRRCPYALPVNQQGAEPAGGHEVCTCATTTSPAGGLCSLSAR